MTKICQMCHKKPAKRVTILYMLPNKHVGFFKNFLRRSWKNLAGSKSYVCEDCFFECHYGLCTFTCDKCKKTFKITMDDFYGEDELKLQCPFCGSAITWDCDNIIEYKDNITREYIRNNPKKTFLFGDNLQKKGYGGQAKEMRGEPNCIGIPTKKKPTMDNDAFFTDDEFKENVHHIDKAIKEVTKLGNNVIVIPSSGIGTGMAKLEEKAPRTFQYLKDKLDNLQEM